MGKKTTASLVLALSSALVPAQETKAAVQNNFSLEDFSLEKFFQKKQSFKIAAILNTKSDRGLLGFSPGPSYSGQDSNIKCYANTTDNSAKTLQDKLTCGVGQQPSQDLSSCVPCPEGTYSNTTSSDICTACAPGYEPNLASGATSCVACPEGEYSPLGKECKACTTGLLNVSKTTCTYCSRYQYHNIETGNTSSTCDSCLNWCESLQFKTDYPSTTYPTDNEDAITYCKKRAYVQTELTYILGGVDYGTYNKCALCDRGEVANPNTNACIPVFCEGGQFVNDAAECEWCESDEFTTGQQSECFSCTNYGFNHAFNDSRTACTLCTGRTEPTKISAILWASLGKDPNDYDTYAHLTCQDIFENTPTDSESCQEMGYRWYVSDEYFTDEHCVNNQNQQVKLYQIRSCAGQLGGLIQKAANLSKDSWISEKATVCGVQALDGTWADARVEGNSNITPDDYLVIKRNTVKETDLLGDVTLNETVTNSIHLTGTSSTHNTIDGIKPIVINDGFTMTGGTLKGGTFSGGVVSGGTIGQATMTGGNVGGDAKIGLTGTGAPDTTSSIVISAGTINGGNINGAVNITGSSVCPAAGCSALTILGGQNTSATYSSPRTRMTLSGGTIFRIGLFRECPNYKRRSHLWR
ncbi:MAG: hypothetical protein PHI50_03535, partial [Alphaproteobacteria bacterium]|nr:hypothetical protein [Alphaproteobacteria bacterium]